jgi:hypothetical protein
MRHALFACAALALATSPLLAADETAANLMRRKEVSLLEPLSPWNIDYGEQKCRLSRLFGPRETPHLLYIEQASPGATFTLAVAGPEFAKVQRDRVLKLGIAEDQIAREVSALTAEFGKIGNGLIVTRKRLREPAPLAAGEVVWNAGQLDPREGAAIKRIIFARNTRAIVFETGELGGAAQAMNACTEDLLSEWGLDVAQHKRFQAAKVLNGEAVAKRVFDTYPRKALLKDEEGDFSARLIVEADGTVSECALEGLTVNEALRPELCQYLREARFEPARGADGQPIRSFYVLPISYRLQG